MKIPSTLARQAACRAALLLAGPAARAQFGPPTRLSMGTGSHPYGLELTNSLYSLAVADLNTDGRPDLLVAGSAGVGVVLGSASTIFQLLVQYPLAGVVTVNDAVAADVSGDGQPDVLTANFAATATASVLPGTGTLRPAATYTVGPASCLPSRVAAADLNADGRPDLVTANLNNNTLSVLLNTTPLATRAALPGGQAQLSPNPADATGIMLTLSNLPVRVQRVQATLRKATGREVARPELAARQGTARALLPPACTWCSWLATARRGRWLAGCLPSACCCASQWPAAPKA